MTRKQGEKITVPFHPLTKEEIKQWYQDKLLTTAGYLLSIKKITIPPGKSLVIPNVLKFCDEWEISKSAFYRAVNELRQKGYADWEATHGIILKESEKVVSISTENKCPTRGTPSHEWDADSHGRDTNSHGRDTNSHGRDGDSHERDGDIYIDRARAQSITDIYKEDQSCVEKSAHTNTTSLAEIGNFEEPVQIPSTTDTQINQSLHCQSSSSVKTIVPPPQVEVVSISDKKDPWVFDPKMEDLVNQLDRGELKDLPINEKKQLANYLMGEQVKQYRRNGWILSIRANDISTDFLWYVAWKELKQSDDLEWARNTVVSYERDMTKWGQLVALIEGWRTVTPEELAATASARVAAKRGSKEDLQIAIQASLDGYQNLDEEYSIFRKKA